MELVNRTQKFSFNFLFLNLDTVLTDSIPENFAIILQINWNWSMKFETVVIHFLSDVFSFLVVLKFCNYDNVT